MPARLVSDDERHVVIRPLVYVDEEDAPKKKQQLYEPELSVVVLVLPEVSFVADKAEVPPVEEFNKPQ